MTLLAVDAIDDVPLVGDGRLAGQAAGLVSPRQAEILQAIADGATTKQVASQLGISVKTVHNHLNAVYQRVGTQTLVHTLLFAVRHGIVTL